MVVEPMVVKTVSKRMVSLEKASFALESVSSLSFRHEVEKNKTVITVKKVIVIYASRLFRVLIVQK